MPARDPHPRLHCPSRGRDQAFTIVELLVVISVIAVLMSLLLPALAGARDSARTTRCLANVRSTAQALMMYADDFKERLPHWSAWQTYRGDGASNEDTPGPGWAELIEDHLGGSLAALSCPARQDPMLPVGFFLQSLYTARLSGSAFFSSLALHQVQFSQQFVLTGDGTNPSLYARPFGNPHLVPNFDPDDARWQAVFYPGETRPHGARSGRTSEESSDASSRGSGQSVLAFLDASAAPFAKYDRARMTWHGTDMRSWLDTMR